MKIDNIFLKITEDVVDRAIEGMNEAIEILKDEADRQTPEDTGTLLYWNTIIPVERKGNVLEGSLENQTDYALYVEMGVRSKSYNYHKPKGKVFYTWIGARMFTKARDFKKAEVLEHIRKKILW